MCKTPKLSGKMQKKKSDNLCKMLLFGANFSKMYPRRRARSGRAVKKGT